MKLLKEEERHLNKEVYNALRNMGVSDNEAQTIAAQAARYDKRFDSLERSMFAIQTGLRTEIKDAIATSEKNTTKAIQDLRTEMKDAIATSEKNMTNAISELKTEIKTTTAEWKTSMRWMFGISMVILGSLAALLIQSLV